MREKGVTGQVSGGMSPGEGGPEEKSGLRPPLRLLALRQRRQGRATDGLAAGEETGAGEPAGGPGSAATAPGRVRPARPVQTRPVQLRLDPEVYAFFKDQGKGHITRMQEVLRAHAEAHGIRTGSTAECG